jgi:hypothetical protein
MNEKQEAFELLNLAIKAIAAQREILIPPFEVSGKNQYCIDFQAANNGKNCTGCQYEKFCSASACAKLNFLSMIIGDIAPYDLHEDLTNIFDLAKIGIKADVRGE